MNLADIYLRRSDDLVKRELELTCSLCDVVLCDAEDGDSIALLAGCTTDHQCEEKMLLRKRLIAHAATAWHGKDGSVQDSEWTYGAAELIAHATAGDGEDVGALIEDTILSITTVYANLVRLWREASVNHLTPREK
jgi:hypothetical protein